MDLETPNMRDVIALPQVTNRALASALRNQLPCLVIGSAYVTELTYTVSFI